MLGDVNPVQVRVTPGQQIIYRLRDNKVDLRFGLWDGRRDTPLDFSAVTRIVLIFTNIEPQVVFDSMVMPTAIDWTSAGILPGQIRFDINDLGYPVMDGGYEAMLIAFDDQHPAGQVLTSREGFSRLVFTVQETYLGGTVPKPLPTGGESAIRTAGETISALRVVYERAGKVFVLDYLDGANIDFLLGVTVTAANTGGTLVVQRQGTIDEAGWTWANDLVYLGADGLLTQTPPTIGWEVVIGNAPSPIRLNLAISDPVHLAQEQ